MSWKYYQRHMQSKNRTSWEINADLQQGMHADSTHTLTLTHTQQKQWHPAVRFPKNNLSRSCCDPKLSKAVTPEIKEHIFLKPELIYLHLSWRCHIQSSAAERLSDQLLWVRRDRRSQAECVICFVGDGASRHMACTKKVLQQYSTIVQRWYQTLYQYHGSEIHIPYS